MCIKSHFLCLVMLTIENALILLYVKDKAPYIAKAGKRKEEYNKKMIAYNKKSVCCRSSIDLQSQVGCAESND